MKYKIYNLSNELDFAIRANLARLVDRHVEQDNKHSFIFTVNWQEGDKEFLELETLLKGFADNYDVCFGLDTTFIGKADYVNQSVLKEMVELNLMTNKEAHRILSLASKRTEMRV